MRRTIAPSHRLVAMWIRRLRIWVQRALLGMAGLQLATAAVLLIIDNRRKKNRAPAVFPKADPTPVNAATTQVTVYTYGADLYDDMLAAIDSAQHTVYLESFIWKGDAIGEAFRTAVNGAAERGVEVYLVWDQFANLVVKPSFYDFDSRVHIQRHPLLVGGWLFFLPRNFGRNHRKLLVVDGRIAFLGGYNIGSLYATDWRDTHVALTGEAVPELENAFIDYWNLRPSKKRDLLPDATKRPWFTPVRVQRNVPRHSVFPIRGMYMEAIDRADKRVWLTSAYLIPDDDFIEALAAAVQRGADVRVLVPARSNHIVADWVSRGYYRRLLKAGVRLFLYQGAMVHAKTAMIDDEWATVGTANIDALSLRGNYELNLEFFSEEVAAKMAEVFELDLTNCTELTLAEWQSRHVMMKFSEAVLKPLSPLL